MLKRSVTHLRRQPLALLALFVALGGGGAYAAGQLGGAQTRGFNVVAANASGTVHGTLAKLGGVTLGYSSKRMPEGRFCRIDARAGGKGEVHGFVAVQPSSGAPKSWAIVSHAFKKPGASRVVAASFDEGAPGISRQVEAQLEWRSATSQSVATSVLHLSAESNRCAFVGTLTAAG